VSDLGQALAAARATLTAPGAAFEIVDEDVRRTTMPVFRHRARSLRELLDGTARHADRRYLVDGEVRLDYGTHLDLVDRLAAVLQRDREVRPGDRVAIFAANRWEWVVAFWAVTTAGAIPCCGNGWWTPDEFAHAASLVGPSLVIGDGTRLACAGEAGWRGPVLDLDDVRVLVDSHTGARPSPVAVAEDDPAVLLFTSGTTGRAKAVTTTHRGLVGFGHVNSFSEAVARVAMGAPVPQVGEPLPPSDDVVLVTSPLFHTSMLHGVVLRSAVRGSAFVLLPGRFGPERVLEAIERERVTSWLALGSAAPRVCALPDRDRYDTSSLTHVGVGGAPVSPTVQQALRDTFPTASRTLSMGYASTESSSVVANIAGAEYAAHPTSTGRIAATIAVELRGPDGAPVADGEVGEVHVRSPYVMLGYWNDPESSAAVLRDGGWLAMGDLGRLVDGRLYIDTRARDLILVSAENVSPTEVEHCLETHPDVLEAGVVAVDDAVTSDAVCAVVVMDPTSAVTTDELASWCRARLAHYKVPTRWHVAHEPLPRTASGKLVKHAIRDLAEPAEPT
jgi:acyl-CoA synthetase (AMP-forming)/AMP-acid ligase II